VAHHYYGTFNAPQHSETPNAEQTFLAAASERGVAVQIVSPGNFVNWKNPAVFNHCTFPFHVHGAIV
jgi:hypothetical protein